MEVWISACAESLLSYYRIIAVLCIQIITMNIGAIFDWDGVIIDSSRYHEESWEKLAQQENKALPHNYLISQIFEDRQEGDYVALTEFDHDYVENRLAQCGEFLAQLCPLVSSLTVK